MKFLGILLTVICFATGSAFAGPGDLAKKVGEALRILNKEQCSLDTFQERVDLFCQTVTGKDVEKLSSCFKKEFPCADIAPDLSSITTYINGKSFTLKMNVINLACGNMDFSFIPSDGCMTAEDFEKASNALEAIVNQGFDALLDCVDGLRPPLCPNMAIQFLMKEQLDYVKALLAMTLGNHALKHPCDSQCQDGRDSNGFVTQECCTQKGWIFLTKNDNKNYCCPPKNGTIPKCPMNQELNNQCISSCRVGTKEINGECCSENQIAQVNGVLECCPSDQSPSSPAEDTSNSICCPTDQKALSTQKGDCCSITNIIEENGKKICCPSERTLREWAKGGNGFKTKCCPEGEIVANHLTDDSKCCPSSNVGKNGYNPDSSHLYCCDGEFHLTNGYCCWKDQIWFDDE